MATLMILVTQDYYLFQGVKNFFPDIIQLDSSGKAILDNEVDEVSLLVDSRFAITIISCWQRRNPESEYVVSSSICAIGKSIY